MVATLQGGTLMYPWHQLALAVIANSAGNRPVYFAASGNTPRNLGLHRNIVREGLAYRLQDGPQEASDDVIQMTDRDILVLTGPWVNLPRTRTLAEEVFVHRAGIPDEWTHWPDEATVGIPSYYSWMYLALAEAGQRNADADLVASASERAIAWQSFSR